MLVYASNYTQYNIGRGKQNTNNVESIVLIYFLLSYLSWKKKEHAKKRKEKPNKQTLVLKTSTVSTYKIKVRNKQQGTRMPPTKMFEKKKRKDETKGNK